MIIRHAAKHAVYNQLLITRPSSEVDTEWSSGIYFAQRLEDDMTAMNIISEGAGHFRFMLEEGQTAT
jgi:hypothetical protein